MWRQFMFHCLLLFCISVSKGNEQCDDDKFTCVENGHCIDMKWKCDGSPDCFDDSDERDCPKKTCSDEFFQCDDGKCISDRWVCDESADCDDNSDEKHELCEKRACAGYSCQSNNHCIPVNWKCDGNPDCPGGDDEKDCLHTCSKNEIKCPGSMEKCIDQTFLCDGHADCDNGTDEIDCGKCDEGHFTCNDGQCINDQWECDGEYDCSDKSDEANCTIKELINKTCGPQMFQCTTPLNELSCVVSAWRCDGDPDCLDESDEKDCLHTCNSDEVLCETSKYCLKNELLCDEQDDCPDGSDERNCTYNLTPAPKCPINKFDCNGDGSKCIFDQFKCDGNDDCGNYADEQNCPVENVCKEDNGGCQHECVPSISSPAGRYCECHSGFELIDGSETDCKDIDECKITGTCSQICINRKGTYKCECEDDYYLTDHRYCKAKSGHHPELIISDDHDIRRYELTTFHYRLLLEDQKVNGAVAMDFDIRKEMVYYAGTHADGVYSANLQTSEVKPVLTKNIKSADGLAVDWVHGNLYVSDTGFDHIMVSRLDGTYSKVLLSEDMDEPRALVVNPYHGWMYWTDWGSDPKIEKCGMNGKERKSIVTSNIVWPNGLAIDYVGNRLYWVDAKMHHIGSTDLDGNDFRLVLKGHRRLGHPFAITVFEDYVYWTDWIDNSIYKTSKFGSGDVATIAIDLKTPYDVRVYHIYRQPSKINHCGENYGGCSHLCLPVPQHVTGTQSTKRSECACPDGMTLKDNSNCVNSSDSEPILPKPREPTIPDKKGNPNRPKTKITPKITVTTPKITVATPKITVTTPKTVSKEATEEATTVRLHETTEQKHVNGTEKSAQTSNPVGPVAGIAVAVILSVALLLGIVIIILVRRYKKKNVKSMNFDNPVYRKTTTEDQLIVEKSRLERESMQPLNQEPEIV